MTTESSSSDLLAKCCKDLIDVYWNLAYAEGREGRNHDTPAGDAGRTLHSIHTLIDLLSSSGRMEAAIANLDHPGTLAGDAALSAAHAAQVLNAAWRTTCELACDYIPVAGDQVTPNVFQQCCKCGQLRVTLKNYLATWHIDA